MRFLILTLLGLELTLQAAAPPATVYTCDLRPLNRLDLSNPDHAARIWDTLHTFAALQGLGFTRVKVLHLESDFGSNWVDQGYPYARGE